MEVAHFRGWHLWREGSNITAGRDAAYTRWQIPCMKKACMKKGPEVPVPAGTPASAAMVIVTEIFRIRKGKKSAPPVVVQTGWKDGPS